MIDPVFSAEPPCVENLRPPKSSFEDNAPSTPQTFFDPTFEVQWNGCEDEENPRTWPQKKRWAIILIASLLAMNSSFGSSAPSMNIAQYVQYFGTSKQLALATISLFVSGYCAGPLAWGPASETYGRRKIFMISMLIYTFACFGCGLSKNIFQLLICRFIAGCSAAASLCISGAVIGDLFKAEMRGIGVSIFSLAPICGVAVSPVVGAYIEFHKISWKWMYWISGVSGSIALLLVALFLPETYHPIILQRKTQKLRKDTGDDRYWASLDKKKTDLRSQLYNCFVKPFSMLFKEPLLFIITAYISFLYGILYMPFETFTLITTQVHHLQPIESGVCFLAIFAGGIVSTLAYLYYFAPQYRKKSATVAPEAVHPEIRLEIGKIGAIFFPISILIMGWTGNSASISIAFPVFALGLMGASILSLFMALFTYLIDTYLASCATAMAINIVIRSLFGSIFMLFGQRLFEKLGINWASTLVSGIALLGSPIPFVLQAKGAKIRQRSRLISNEKDSFETDEKELNEGNKIF